jgi:hypothetical protein
MREGSKTGKGYSENDKYKLAFRILDTRVKLSETSIYTC